MTTDNWINLIAAILVGGGTLFLGIMAWRTIRQTRNMQKAEKRERLLNEIIEWAINVTKCEIILELADLTAIKNMRAGLDLFIMADKERFTFKELKRRSFYISRVVSAFGQDLQLVIEKLTKRLEVHLELLNEYKDAILGERPDEIESLSKKLDDNKNLLDEFAEEILEEVAKIKTKDIS